MHEIYDKDSRDFQEDRIRRAARLRWPDAEISFDQTRFPIHVQVYDPVRRRIILNSVGDWLASEIADKTDAELEGLLASWEGDHPAERKHGLSAARGSMKDAETDGKAPVDQIAVSTSPSNQGRKDRSEMEDGRATRH